MEMFIFILLAWAWIWPESFGRWLRDVKAGFNQPDTTTTA